MNTPAFLKKADKITTNYHAMIEGFRSMDEEEKVQYFLNRLPYEKGDYPGSDKAPMHNRLTLTKRAGKHNDYSLHILSRLWEDQAKQEKAKVKK